MCRSAKWNSLRSIAPLSSFDFFWPFITSRPSADPGPELWVPGGAGDVPRTAVNEDLDVTGNRNAGYIRVVARLAPGDFAASTVGFDTRAETLAQTRARLGLMKLRERLRPYRRSGTDAS